MTRRATSDTPPTIVVAHPSADLYGSDRQLVESVVGLVEAGWRVITVLPHPGPLVEHLRAAGSATAILPSPVLRKAALRPRGFLQLLWSLRSLPAIIRLLRRARPSAVYVNTVTIPAWLALARLRGCSTVCHVHEAEDGIPRSLRLALALPLLLAQRVIVNSQASLSVLTSDLALLRRRSHVIYNGVPGPPAPSSPPQVGPPPLHLTLVGRLSPRKGTDVAIDAVRLLRENGTNVDLELIGDVFPGYEWYEDELRAAAASCGDHVAFTGFIDDVWRAYERAHVALVPSRAEPFGNVAVEGMLASRPVIASRVQGLMEIIDDGETGRLVPPDDPAALAAAIQELYDDWDGAVRMAGAGHDHATREFTTERYRREVAELMASTTRGRPAPAPGA